VLVLADLLQLAVTRLASLPRIPAVTYSCRPPSRRPDSPSASVPSAGGRQFGRDPGLSACCHGRPGLVVVAAAGLGCLHTIIVETTAAVVARLSVPAGLLLPAVAFGGLAVWTIIREARNRIRTLRTHIVADSSLPEHTEPQVASTVRRLAQPADVQEPFVRVVGPERPASMTVGDGDDAVCRYRRGWSVRSRAELEAALAHEVAHPVDGGSRAVGAALGPVLAADE